MKYCWRSRWRGDDGQVWLDSKESCQRRWGMDWFPNMSLFSLTHKPADRHWRFLYAAGMPEYTCAFHPYPSTCSVFTLSQQEEDRTPIPSVQGKQQVWIRNGNFFFFIAVSSGSFSLLVPLRGSSGHSASQTFLASKRTLMLAESLEEGGWRGSRRDKKGRVWVMKMLHVFKSRLAENRTELLLKKP